MMVPKKETIRKHTQMGETCVKNKTKGRRNKREYKYARQIKKLVSYLGKCRKVINRMSSISLYTIYLVFSTKYFLDNLGLSLACSFFGIHKDH